MINSGVPSRQPNRVAWPLERLLRERSLALGCAIDTSTSKNYGSALNSYLNFVHLHELPVEPTPDTLSFFVVYMSHHIQPSSVTTYLSGIVNQLEPYFPDVRATRSAPLVKKTLAGCLRLRGVATTRKHPLSRGDLCEVLRHYAGSTDHDDLLFVTQLLTGFDALLRLGELTYPDDRALHDFRKVTKVTSVVVSHDQYEFLLPGNKTDHIFEGNKIIVRANAHELNPYPHFLAYLLSRNTRFPLSQELWLMKDGRVLTRRFFIKRLRAFFDKSIAGQSMRAGGATFLAEMGVPPHLIQARGRWSSDTFQIYVRKSPVLIQALLFGSRRGAPVVT